MTLPTPLNLVELCDSEDGVERLQNYVDNLPDSLIEITVKEWFAEVFNKKNDYMEDRKNKALLLEIYGFAIDNNLDPDASVVPPLSKQEMETARAFYRSSTTQIQKQQAYLYRLRTHGGEFSYFPDNLPEGMRKKPIAEKVVQMISKVLQIRPKLTTAELVELITDNGGDKHAQLTNGIMQRVLKSVEDSPRSAISIGKSASVDRQLGAKNSTVGDKREVKEPQTEPLRKHHSTSTRSTPISSSISRSAPVQTKIITNKTPQTNQAEKAQKNKSSAVRDVEMQDDDDDDGSERQVSLLNFDSVNETSKTHDVVEMSEVTDAGTEKEKETQNKSAKALSAPVEVSRSVAKLTGNNVSGTPNSKKRPRSISPSLNPNDKTQQRNVKPRSAITSQNTPKETPQSSTTNNSSNNTTGIQDLIKSIKEQSARYKDQQNSFFVSQEKTKTYKDAVEKATGASEKAIEELDSIRGNLEHYEQQVEQASKEVEDTPGALKNLKLRQAQACLAEAKEIVKAQEDIADEAKVIQEKAIKDYQDDPTIFSRDCLMTMFLAEEHGRKDLKVLFGVVKELEASQGEYSDILAKALAEEKRPEDVTD